MKNFFYLNGKIVRADRPAVFVDDIGLLRGYGVFDFTRTFNGKIFYFDEHWQRFVNSTKHLGLKIPVSKKETEKIIYNLLKKNKCQEGSVRLLLTGGRAIDGISFDSRKPTFAILIEEIYQLPTKLFNTGAKLMSFPYQRILPEAKNLNYLWAIKLQKEKKRQGAVEILYTCDKKVLECSTSNFFLVKNNKLITPKKDVLSGITRKIVIALAKKKIPVEERDILIEEIATADEIFISATNKNILPIIKIDQLTIGNGHPGKITKDLMQDFMSLINNY